MDMDALKSLTAEIKALDERISKSDNVVKSDVNKLADRLEQLGKALEDIQKSSKKSSKLFVKNAYNVWETQEQVDGFCDYLADGPLKEMIQKGNYSSDPTHKNYSPLKKISDAGSVSTNADGGYLVPVEYSSFIVDRGLNYGSTLPRVPRMQITGSSIDIATNDTDLGALFAVEGGGATGEDHTKTAQKMVFGHVTITPKTMYALRYVSNKLMRQSRFLVANLVANDLAKSIAKRTAYVVWVADGTDNSTSGAQTSIGANTSVGTVNLSGIAQLFQTNTTGTPNDSDATVKGYDALLKCMNVATSRAQQADTAWYMHRVTLNNLRGLKDSTGQPIVRDMFVPGVGAQPSLVGYPVFTDEIFPSTTANTGFGTYVVFGSLQQGAMIAYNENLAITFSEHARFEKNQSGWKAEIELGFGVTDPGAFGIIKD